MKSGQKVVVEKKEFLHLLSSLLPDHQVIAPVKLPDGDVTFETITSVSEITFDYVNELAPLKRFFFPAKEKLFSFTLNGKEPSLKQADDDTPGILFGIRSCDVQGLAHTDGFFSGSFHDNYYWQKRNNTAIISIACNRTNETCFCICCNGGPWLDGGFDLQLTDFGDRFLIDVGTEKGARLLQPLSAIAIPASESDEEKRQQLMQACDEQMEPVAYLAKAVINITNNRVKEEFWEQLGAECFSCGGCTNICPLCTCFDVFDYLRDDAGERYRCWDSCQYAGFTYEASGHNPRARAKERVKRRFYHKLSYAYIKQDGHPGCVGCGRCITVCQAFNLLDVPAVVKRLRREGLKTETEKQATTV